MIVKTLPQNIQPINITTLRDLVSILPDELLYKVNIWLGDKLARYGVTTENIIFLVEMEEEPSVEMREYFNSLVKPLGITATVSESWKNRKYNAVRVYNEGKLIIDKYTMTYTELPTAVHEAPVLTLKKLMAKLPKQIPFQATLYLTGGLVKNGFTCNDVDFIAFDVEDKERLSEMASYFTEALGMKTDVGNKIMKEREPVYCYLLYEGGCLL